MHPFRPAFFALGLFAAVFVGCALVAQTEKGSPPMTPAAATVAPRRSADPSRCAREFASYDADRDARLSLEELADRAPANVDPDVAFRLRDRDRDGFLIESEFCTRLATPCYRAPAFAAAPSDELGRPAFCDQDLESFDLSGDGTITEREFFETPGVARNSFALFVDANGDRVITWDELCRACAVP